MKNFTKSIGAALLFFALFATSTTVKAQMSPGSGVHFGIGIEGGLPTYSLRNFSKTEVGGTLRLEYDIRDQFAITLTSGYYSLLARNKDNTTTTFGPDMYDNKPHNQGIIPVKIGVKDFICKNFYLGMETGAGFETKYDTDTKFILAPGIGFATKSVDVGARYEYLSGSNNNYGFVGLRIGFTL